jgi:hypothetical protein
LLKVKARFRVGCLDGSAALRVHKNLVYYCIFNSDSAVLLVQARIHYLCATSKQRLYNSHTRIHYY